MKIVAINGSHRGERGYTQFLIQKVFQGAQQAGAQCETIVLAQHTIHRCLGCRVCHTEKSYLKCVYDEKDDVRQLFDIMRSADMLLYATPIYIFTMTGLMKIFLDRITSTADSSILALSKAGLLFHHIDTTLLSKPFVILTCQDNIENETSQSVVAYFRTFSRFLDAPLVGILTRTSGALVGHGKDKDKACQYPKIQQVYAALVNAGEELVLHGKISGKTQKRANQRILNMPVVLELLLQSRVIRKNTWMNNRMMEKIFQKATAWKNEHH